MTVGELQDIIDEFDQKYPNSLENDAIEYIKTSGRTKNSLLLSLLISIISIWFLADLLQKQPQDQLLTIIVLLTIATFAMWKLVRSSIKFWLGWNALMRNISTAGIARDDLRKMRRAFRQIRTWRKNLGGLGDKDKLTQATMTGALISTQTMHDSPNDNCH